MLTRFANQSGDVFQVKPHIFVDSAASLESAFHKMIPISGHMGIRVLAYDGSRLTLAAPLANNINHQQSAFGGSLFSIAALAGWGLLQLKLGELDIDAETVIASGDVSYSRPVFADFQCVCSLPDKWPAFEERLTARGKAPIKLAPCILVDGQAAMQLTGTYVVIERRATTA